MRWCGLIFVQVSCSRCRPRQRPKSHLDENATPHQWPSRGQRRRVPIECKGGRRRIGRDEAKRVGLELKVRIEDVEAKTLQVVEIRGDVHAIAAGSGPLLSEVPKACPIPSGNRHGKLVCLPAADAKAGAGRYASTGCSGDHKLAVELRVRACREIRPARRKSPESSGARVHHEGLAPVSPRCPSAVIEGSISNPRYAFRSGWNWAWTMFLNNVRPVMSSRRRTRGEAAVGELNRRERSRSPRDSDKRRGGCQHFHQPHRDHDRFVPALPFDQLDARLGVPPTPPSAMRLASKLYFWRTRRGCPHEERNATNATRDLQVSEFGCS